MIPPAALSFLDRQADAVVGRLAERRLGARHRAEVADEDRVAGRACAAPAGAGVPPGLPRRTCRPAAAEKGGAHDGEHECGCKSGVEGSQLHWSSLSGRDYRLPVLRGQPTGIAGG